MECAICDKPGVGYWCSEEHQQRWYAQRVPRLPGRPAPRVPGAAVLWGVATRDDHAA